MQNIVQSTYPLWSESSHRPSLSRYWFGDHEGNSQPDGGSFLGRSFHTAHNYARMAYLMLNNGQWEVNERVTQLLDPAWVHGAASAPALDWSPCPYYAHSFWRKPLNAGRFIQGGKRVPTAVTPITLMVVMANSL